MSNSFPFSLCNFLCNRDLDSSFPKIFICYFVWPPYLKDVPQTSTCLWRIGDFPVGQCGASCFRPVMKHWFSVAIKYPSLVLIVLYLDFHTFLKIRKHLYFPRFQLFNIFQKECSFSIYRYIYKLKPVRRELAFSFIHSYSSLLLTYLWFSAQ